MSNTKAEAWLVAEFWLIAKILGLCLACGVAVGLLVGLAGCTDVAFVSAMRDQYDATADEYAAYVSSDTTLTTGQVRIRKAKVRRWNAAIRSAEGLPPLKKSAIGEEASERTKAELGDELEELQR